METLIHLVNSGRSKKDVNHFGLLGKEGLRSVSVIVLLFFTLTVYSTNYYVSSSSGNDANSGTSENSAWRSLAKVNSFTPSPGDQILFKRGDEWVGTITVKASGTSGSPIVYGAYGTGDKPKIYGSEVITGWTLHNGNIWKAKVASDINQLFVDGKRIQNARFPKEGYLYIDKVNSSTSVTCNDLNSGIDYAGAKIHTRTVQWRLITSDVISSSSTSLTVKSSPSYGFAVGRAFFLNNHIQFLTQPGEWHYDVSTRTVYVWMDNSDTPANYEVRGSMIENSVYIEKKDFITIKDLAIEHSKGNALHSNASNYLTLDNLAVSNPSWIGFYVTNSRNLKVSNNYIRGAMSDGMYLSNGSIDWVGELIEINDNEIRDVAAFEEIGVNGIGLCNGIFVRIKNAVVKYNKIFNNGYNGIQFYGQNTRVENNLIDGYCKTLNDGGGIYTWVGLSGEVPLSVNSSGSIVLRNIVLNGDNTGTGYYKVNTGSSGVHALYADLASTGVLFENNTVAQVYGQAVFYNKTVDVISRGNTLFDCSKGLRLNYLDAVAKANEFSNNIVYHLNSTNDYGSTPQFSALSSSAATEVKLNSNLYVNRVSKYSDVLFRNLTAYSGMNFTSWQSFTNGETNSTFIGTPLTTGETEQLFYNDTKQNKIFNLGTTVYNDIYGNEVTGKLTLEPFTSKILIKTTKTVQLNQRPVVDSQSFNAAGPVNVNDFIGKVEASDPDAGQTLTYSIIQGNAENLFTLDPSTGELYAKAEIKSTEDQVFNLTVEVTDDASSPLTASAEVTVYVSGVIEDVPEPDILAPSISSFIIPAESNSLTVLISSFSASDNVGVAGYLLTESNTSPSSGDAGWSSSSPAEYTFATEGTHTLYAWVKDASGNVSSPLSRSVTITLPDLSSAFSEYLFEESNGVNILDSECSNDGIIVNDGLRVDGANGRGLELSGSGYISFGQCFGENVQDEVSMSAWIKPDAGSSGYQGIIMHGGPNTDTYALYIYPNTKTIGFKTTGTTSSWFAIDNVEKLWDGNWHHLVAVYNGTEKIIYLDNTVISVISAEGTIESGYGYNLLVGAGRDDTNPTLLYDGMLDEVRIYNYAITLTEVSELYHPVNRELNKISTVEDITICEGEDYMGWTEPGQYERVLQRKLESASGADSVVTTNLYVNPVYSVTIEAAICEGEIFSFGSQIFSESGEYKEVFKTVNGCDSTVVLTLTVNNTYQITEEITIVEGENYLGWSKAGTYERSLVSSSGCDSIIVTKLSVVAIAFTEENISICEGSSYNGWDTSGRYERKLQSVSGGDSIVVTNLTVNPVYSETTEVAICEGEIYTFGSQILTESGEYTEVFEALTGCDSIVYLSLTVIPKYYITEDITIYDDENYYGWNVEGIYERNFISSLGCDSVVVTNLKVVSTLVTKEDIEICQGSSYNGWTESGRYERTLESVSGGDSMVVTNLTVNPVYSVTKEVAICEGETYSLGTQMLSEPGEYTEVFETIHGCDSTVVLTLTVNENYYTTEDITIYSGESYNGWTEEGTYQRNLISVTGCDSIVVTNLIMEQTASQTIYLDAGWNIISSYLIPVDVNMETVMQSLQSSGNLVKVQDEVNNTLEYRNKNIGWVNGIGDLQKTEGYKVQVTSDCTLEVKGQKVSLPLDIPISGGWNIISYPGEESVDAMQVVQPLIDAGVLVKVQDEAGNSIEYWKKYGWLNGIGNFKPGEGYIIQVTSAGLLTIGETYTKSGQILAKSAETSYFQVDYQGNGIDHMNVNIVELAGSGLKVGDEIATFDNAICVGAIKLTEQHFELDAVSIPASASEEGMNNGYLDGNSIELKVWSMDTNEEINLSAKTIEGEMVYNRQASVFVALSNLSVNTNELLESGVNIDVYPNPASSHVNIRFSAMPEFGTYVSIFDMSGRQVVTKEVEADITVINIENLQPGTYIIQVPVNGRIIPRKLIKR